MTNFLAQQLSNMTNSFRFLILLFLVMSVVSGCGPVAAIPVSGTVKYSDGSIPQGEVVVVRFEPLGLGEGKGGNKAASGDITQDGSFQLSTLNPNDGAFPGEYKVTFSVFKTYRGRESLIDPKFTMGATTPFQVSVKSGEKNHFEFTIERIKDGQPAASN